MLITATVILSMILLPVSIKGLKTSIDGLNNRKPGYTLLFILSYTGTLASAEWLGMMAIATFFNFASTLR